MTVRGRWWLALVSLALSIAACAPDAATDATGVRTAAISGGQLAPGRYPAVVGIAIADELDDTLSLLCTGTLIARDVVLTAAHCLIGSPPRLRVFVGDDVDNRAAGKVYEVVRQRTHPLWSESGSPPQGVGQANDLALLFVGSEITGVDAMALPSSAEVKAELVVRAQTAIVGYGAEFMGGPAGAKQAADGARVSQVGDFELALSHPGEPQACEGDSGGPALLPLTDGSVRIIGVASRASGSGTACNGGAVYTRVDSYVDFLRAEVPTVCVGAGCAGGGANGDGGLAGDVRPPSNVGVPGPSGSGTTRPISEGGCALAGRVDLHRVTGFFLLALLLAGLRRRRS